MTETRPLASVGQPGTGSIPWQDRVDVPAWEKPIVNTALKGLKGPERRARMIELQDELSAERRTRAEANRAAIESLSEVEFDPNETLWEHEAPSQ